jgi:hypothetical protein
MNGIGLCLLLNKSCLCRLLKVDAETPGSTAVSVYNVEIDLIHIRWGTLVPEMRALSPGLHCGGV